ASQRIRIFEVAHSLVAKTARELSGFVVKITAVNRVPDYINPNSIVGNILQYVLNLGEPPTTSRSGRRKNSDESNLAGVPLERLLYLVNIAQSDNLACIPLLTITVSGVSSTKGQH